MEPLKVGHDVTIMNLLFINKILVSQFYLSYSCINFLSILAWHFLHFTWLGALGIVRNIQAPCKQKICSLLIHRLGQFMWGCSIGRMIGLDYRNKFSMVSILVCMVAHWIGPMVSCIIDYQVIKMSPKGY